MELFLNLVCTFVIGPVLCICVYWLFFNNPKGERYLKYRTQGPFAPLPGDKPLQTKTTGKKSNLQ